MFIEQGNVVAEDLLRGYLKERNWWFTMGERENELLERLYQLSINNIPGWDYMYHAGSGTIASGRTTTDSYELNISSKNTDAQLVKNTTYLPGSNNGNATYELSIKSNGKVVYHASNEKPIKELYNHLDRQRLDHNEAQLKLEEQKKLAPLEQLLATLEEPTKKKDGRRK